MLITQDTKNRTHNLELGGGLESGDGGECVIGIEELEKQVSAKGGRTHCGRPQEARNWLLKIVKSPSRSTSNTLSKFDFTNFQIMEAPAMSITP